jgi:cytochrome c oxidase subunit 3
MTAAPIASGASAHDAVKHVRMNRLGLWLFFVSDGLVFSLLLAARFYMNGTHTPDHVSQLLGLGITSILLLSSLTAYRAETAIAHGNVASGRTMLLATIALGVVFLAGVVMEWSVAEFSPAEGYGTAFFSMTGMHATHVASGVLLLLLAYRAAGRGVYAGGGTRAYGVSAIVMYWHFVDVVWVFFYPALYLLR